MKVAIHQPGLFQWSGLYSKMKAADIFVILDTVQFEKNNYQNRCKVKAIDGKPNWITMSVKRQFPAPITSIHLANYKGDIERALGKLVLYYNQAPNFKRCHDFLRTLSWLTFDKLVDLDVYTMNWAKSEFGIKTKMIRASELGELNGAKTDLLVDICQKLGADTYLSGRGGSIEYLEVERFEDVGISVEWHEFIHPLYKQLHNVDFIPGLSSLDYLMNSTTYEL